MAVRIGQMTSEVTAVDGEMPLNQAQLEKIVRLVIKRLEEQQRNTQQNRDATRLRREVAPPLPFQE